MTKQTYAKRTQKSVNGTVLQLTLREMQGLIVSPKFWFSIFAVIIVLAVSGPFSTLQDFSFSQRLAYWGAIAVLTFFANMAAALPMQFWLKHFDLPFWMPILLAGIVGGLPVTLIVWFINSQIAGTSTSDFQTFLHLALQCIPISVMVTASYMVIADQIAPEPQPERGQTTEAPLFFKRLPIALGTDILSLQAQDHYVQVTTARGRDMVLVRLEDAIAELAPLEGVRTHRSWWVATSAITSLKRDGSRQIAILKNGEKVPVSRTYSRAVGAVISKD